MHQRTKNQLARALMELSKTKPIDDISVKDITDRCELVRNSFYYHFQDKQDLMKYIYTEFRKTLKMEEGYQKENTIQFINYMKEYPYFFKQAFRRDEQNNFRDELIELMKEDYLSLLANQNHPMPEHTRYFLSLFYAYGTVGMFEYVINHEETDVQEIANDFEIAMKNRIV